MSFFSVGGDITDGLTRRWLGHNRNYRCSTWIVPVNAHSMPPHFYRTGLSRVLTGHSCAECSQGTSAQDRRKTPAEVVPKNFYRLLLCAGCSQDTPAQELHRNWYTQDGPGLPQCPAQDSRRVAECRVCSAPTLFASSVATCNLAPVLPS